MTTRIICQADHRPEGAAPGAVVGSYENAADAEAALETLRKAHAGCDFKLVTS